SWPPQSPALVRRTASVPYGAGKLKRPRDGRNDWMVADDNFGRSAPAVAESTNPPDCARAERARPESTTIASTAIRRWVPFDKTSLLTVWQTGIDTAHRRECSRVVSGKNRRAGLQRTGNGSARAEPRCRRRGPARKPAQIRRRR